MDQPRKKFIQQYLKTIQEKRRTTDYTPWETDFIDNMQKLVNGGFWDLSSKQYNMLQILSEKGDK